MLESNGIDVFEMIKFEISGLKGTGKITHSNESFFKEILNKLQDFYLELRNEITNLSEISPIDLEYYTEIFHIENGKLKESNVDQNDPVYPIYKHVEGLLNIHNHLKISSKRVASNRLLGDSLCKSILITKKSFLNNLNMAICDKYTLKEQNYTYKRMHLEKENKKKLNIIIFKHIDIQHVYFYDHLTASQLQLPEFIHVLASFQIIKISYDEFCKDENFGEIEDVLEFKTLDLDKNAVLHLRSNMTKFDNSFKLISNKTSITNIPEKLKPEALTLEQNFRTSNDFYEFLENTRSNKNVPAASSLTSTGINYSEKTSFTYFPFLILICVDLGFLKRIFLGRLN